MSQTASAVESDSRQKNNSQKDRKSAPNRPLPTERIAFPKQLDILRVYAAASGPSNKAVTVEEVGAIVKLKPSTVRMANPFLTDVGLLQKTDSGYIPSADVVSFNRAYQWNPENAGAKLAPTIRQTWFATALLPTIEFRSIERKEAIQLLADAVGAGPEYEDQLGVALDYLIASGLVSAENGNVRINHAASSTGQTKEQPANSTPEPKEQSPKPTTVSTAFSKPTEGVVQFHVSVKVDMAEFSGWQADRIAAFFSGIAQVLAAKGAIEEDASAV